jgi:hypothetical protein
MSSESGIGERTEDAVTRNLRHGRARIEHRGRPELGPREEGGK